MTPDARANVGHPAASETVAARKAAARQQAIARRDAMDARTRDRLSAKIAAAELPFLTGRSRVVSAFHPVGAELDIMKLVRRLVTDGHVIALPIVVGRGQPLMFRAWRPGEPLEAGVRGIPVPPAGAPEVTPEILLVPLLAFDARGYRLGYGAGFYDLTLAKLRAAGEIVAAGVAFAAQEVPEVPVEAHDQRLDWIVTEHGARPAGREARG